MASYGEPLTRTDNKINDILLLSSQGEQSLGEPLIRTDNSINYPPILSNQGEQPLANYGEPLTRTDNNINDIIIVIKSRRTIT